MAAPSLKKPIPAQVINEQAAYGPFNLNDFIQSEDKENLRFSAELVTGQSLPKGMICTADGILTGIPARGTEGSYEVVVTIENDDGPLQAEFLMTIKPSLLLSGNEYNDKLKAQIWEALEQNLPLPDLGEIYDRPITFQEVYYLLERWAVLVVWDAFNLEPPGEKTLLELEDCSVHFNVYDRGSSIVAAPKDLFSHERTIADALQTARAVAREVYRRGWTIELAGFEKMTRAAWVELQLLGDKHGKRLEILHFDPGFKEIKVYNEEAKTIALKRT